jgi:hypothetical protein
LSRAYRLPTTIYNRFARWARQRETKPVIPNRSNRKQPYSFSKHLYKLHWRIESAFNRLKDLPRIATRYGRLARNYLASVCLAVALVWYGMVDLMSLALALQLRFLRTSESMGNHDSKIVDAGSVD